jgi:hypothetical protein
MPKNILGLHAPVQGATDAFKQCRANIGASCVLFTAACGPQDATDGVTNLVRLPSPQQGESSDGYIARTHDQIARWYASGIAALFIPGNEPDLAESSGDVPTAYTQAAWEAQMEAVVSALRSVWGGIVLAAPAYSVGNMSWYTPRYAGLFDSVTAHAYWWADKDEMHDTAAGAAWQYATPFGKPVYITEANSNPTTPDQLAAWAAGLPEIVKGVCFYITDDQGHDPQYNITPAQAAAIRQAYDAPVVVPDPVPTPEPLPTPPPAPTGGYSGDSDPRGFRALDGRWLPYLTAHNASEAAAICATYHDACQTIGYDANLAIAQGCVETATFTSARWQNAHAAAGVGIYSDGTPDIIWGESDATPHGTVEAGIRAQCELLSDYYCGGTEPWGILKPHHFGGMNLGKTKLSDMDGVWAADTQYSATISALANGVLGDTVPAPTPPPIPDPAPAPLGPITLADILRVATAHIGNTKTDEGQPEYEWCEQEVEEWLAEAGLARVRYPSAAVHGDAVAAAGLFHMEMPPPPGAVLIGGRAFDPNGHIFVADTYPFVITTYPGTVSRIDAVANGWYASAGLLGWYIPAGVRTEEDDMALPIEGKADDGLYEYAFQRSGQALNKESGIYTRWLGMVKAGVPIGIPTSPEFSFPDGRTCQTFSSGAVMTAVKQEDGTFHVYVN